MKRTLADLEELARNNPIVARGLNCRRGFPDDESMLIAIVRALAEQNADLLAQLIDAARFTTFRPQLISPESAIKGE